MTTMCIRILIYGKLRACICNGWKVKEVDCSSVLVWERELMNFSYLTTLYFRAVVNFWVHLYQKQFCCVADMLLLYTQIVLSRKQQIYLCISHWELTHPSILLVVWMLMWHLGDWGMLSMASLYWSIQFK
jgi:hypothetical protein